MKIRFVFLTLCIAMLALSGLTACGSSHSDDSTVLMIVSGFDHRHNPSYLLGEAKTYGDYAAADKNMLNANGINVTIRGCVNMEKSSPLVYQTLVLLNVPSADVKAAEALGLRTFVEDEAARYTYLDCDTISSEPFITAS